MYFLFIENEKLAAIIENIAMTSYLRFSVFKKGNIFARLVRWHSLYNSIKQAI